MDKSLETAWPPLDTIRTLADAADMLLNQMSYSGEGYEKLGFALASAREYLSQFEPENPIRNEDGTVKVSMIHVGGKSYRCSCGCNCFHQPKESDPDLYECNACQERYRGV